MRKALFWILVAFLAVLPAAAQDANVKITWPPSVYAVKGAVQVQGTVNPPDLQTYYLEVAAYGVDQPNWTPVSLPSNKPVTNGVIGQWTTNLVPDGVYQLRLHVLLKSGQSEFDVVGPIRIANALQAPAGGTVTAAQSAPTQAPQATLAATAAPTQVAAEPTLVPRPNPVNQLPVPVGGQVTYFKDPTIADMKTAGMTWVKWQISFDENDTNLINVARDRINWSHAAGFNVLLSITGQPGQLADKGADYYPIYAQYVGQVAALHPDAIEVWNEMNLDREWPSGSISARSYVAMLQQAYQAIKAADPQVMVITGAPAPTGFYGGCSGAGCDDDAFYANMATDGAAQYADCIGVHYNEGILPPKQTGGDPRDNYPTRYFTLMMNRAANPFRGSDIPLCFTELGYLTPEGYGPLPAGFAWAGNTTIAEQAQWLHDAVQIASTYQQKKVAMIIVFNVDFDRYDQDDPQAGYAIIRKDSTCPACQSLATLMGQG